MQVGHLQTVHFAKACGPFFREKKLMHVDTSNFSVRCHIDRLFNIVKLIKHHMSVVHDISTIPFIPTNT